MIRGNLSFGALVAVLAAYKDMASPWKELLDFYQQKEDSRIKYEQMSSSSSRRAEPAPSSMPPSRSGRAAAHGRAGRSAISRSAEDDRSRVLDAITFTLRLDEHVAVIGQSGSGKNELALLLARLMRPTGGRITIGGRRNWPSCR